MSPYRQLATVERTPSAPGPRWGVTKWRKFWVKHPRLERVALWSIFLVVVFPIHFVVCVVTFRDPFDI